MSTPTTAQKQSFLAAITPLATSYGGASGIDPNLIISQAVLESNYGTQAPNNNYFGIKGSTGGTYATNEYDSSGNLVSTTGSFAGYSSLEDSVGAYVNLLTTSPRYANVVGATGTTAFQNIQADGYGGANNTTMAGRLAAVANSIGLTSDGSGAPIGTTLQAGVQTVESTASNVTSTVLGDAVDAGEIAVGFATGNPLLIAKGISSIFGGGGSSSKPSVIDQFLTWVKNLFSANTAARFVAIVVGVVLIIVALIYLTGTDKAVTTTVNNVAKGAAKAAVIAA